MTAVYEHQGLGFQYPENWKLTDIEDQSLPYQFALESPNGAQWSVNVFPDTKPTSEILDDAINALKAQYDEAELSETIAKIAEREIPATDAHFYCLDFVVHAQLFTCKIEGYHLLFWYQAETRDFDSQLPVFHAITHTMLTDQNAD